MQKYTDVVQDINGNAVSGASVTIKVSPGGSTATIYSTSTGTSQTNPITTDSDGRYTFYAKDGTYYAAVSKSGYTAEDGPTFILKDPTGPICVDGYGAVGDGSTDDTTAWTACVAAVAAAGGGVISGRPGATYVLSSAVTISASNIRFLLDDVTIKLSGSTSFAALDFEGAGVLGTPTLNSDAAIYAKTVSVTALSGITAGGYFMISKDAPSNGGSAALYRFISRVRSVSGAGPYTVTLVSPLPVAFATADAGLELKAISMIENVGVVGRVKFDGSVATGTTVHGIKAQYVMNSQFSGYRGADLAAGSAILAQFGHNNTFENGSARGCGNSSFDAHFIVAQTASFVNNLTTENGTGFGIQLQSSCNTTGYNLMSEGCVVGRGVKFAACLECSFSNLTAHGAVAANGVAVSIGTCRCNFFGINANSNATNEGLWLSDQSNNDNSFHGVRASGNGSRDIYIGTTDLRNTFHGVTAPTVYIGASNATSFFYGLNGALLSGGYSSNAPVTLLNKTSGTNSLLLPLGTGAGGEGWIGQNAAGTVTFLNGTTRTDIYVNNSPTLQCTSTYANVPSGYTYRVADVQVVAGRDTGWTAMTGSTNKATAYDTSTVTTAQLAGRVMALQAALTTHGLIGA